VVVQVYERNSRGGFFNTDGKRIFGYGLNHSIAGKNYGRIGLGDRNSKLLV
jgi:hypothetical protein